MPIRGAPTVAGARYFSSSGAAGPATANDSGVRPQDDQSDDLDEDRQRGHRYFDAQQWLLGHVMYHLRR